MRGLLLLLASLLLATGCRQNTGFHTEASEPLRIAVAANMQYAIKAIETTFEQSSGIAVEILIGSSGKLKAQISQGAPFHLFVSADLSYPTALYEEGKATALPVVYAYGILALWSLRTPPLPFEWSYLAGPAVRNIAIPNPRTAPYGREAMRSLENLQLLPAVEEKLVYGESIAQTNQYILTGACQAGITAMATVKAPENKDKGTYFLLPPSTYEPIAQGLVVTSYGQRKAAEACQTFVSFLLGEAGQRILKDYGYQLPQRF